MNHKSNESSWKKVFFKFKDLWNLLPLIIKIVLSFNKKEQQVNQHGCLLSTQKLVAGIFSLSQIKVAREAIKLLHIYAVCKYGLLFLSYQVDLLEGINMLVQSCTICWQTSVPYWNNIWLFNLPELSPSSSFLTKNKPK